MQLLGLRTLGVPVSLWIMVFSRYMPRSGIAGSYGIVFLWFLYKPLILHQNYQPFHGIENVHSLQKFCKIKASYFIKKVIMGPLGKKLIDYDNTWKVLCPSTIRIPVDRRHCLWNKRYCWNSRFWLVIAFVIPLSFLTTFLI